MRLTWVTDIHLNFLGAAGFAHFVATVAAEQPDRVLVGGDIAEAPILVEHLTRFAAGLDCPVDFVLGNHDYYHGNISDVRRSVRELVADHPTLTWLTQSPPIELGPHTALIGAGGWADAHHGDFMNSKVMLSDYLLIQDLVAPRADLAERLHALGEQSAAVIRQLLESAASRYRRVFLLTHVPPFVGACWHEGEISGDDWLPHFTCKATGDAILDVMSRHPDTALTVLCGHTHSQGTYTAAPNVLVLTGAAEYGEPAIARSFDLP